MDFAAIRPHLAGAEKRVIGRHLFHAADGGGAIGAGCGHAQ